MTSINHIELATWVGETYLLPHATCKHLRSYSNYVYLVTSGTDRFILKLYGAVLRHTDDEILWELTLLDHLSANGAAVAKAVRNASNDMLCTYAGYKAVLFEYAPGDKPEPPFSTSLYYNEGVALAKVHRAADSFKTTHTRVPVDADYLIRKPLQRVLGSLTRDDHKQFMTGFSHTVARAIDDFARQGIDSGPIHGDVTLDNFHVSGSGAITWYDFDSGGPGWRAHDLQGWALLENTTEFLEKREAFLKGYQTVRAVSHADLAASPYLHIASELWGFALDLDRQITEGIAHPSPSFIAERISDLRTRQAQLAALENR